jgi:hypothetical protein
MLKNEDDKSQVEGLFNPTEISISKSVPWNKHKTSKGDSPVLEFTEAQPRELTLELLFDTYESGQDVYKEKIADLEKLTLIRDADSTDPEQLRPPHVRFLWGSFPGFLGVVASLSVKYTMFFSDGTPCRASASIKMTQADRLRAKKASGGPGSESGNTVQEGDRIDQVAPDGDHRGAADRAGIDDPSNLTPGTQIS